MARYGNKEEPLDEREDLAQRFAVGVLSGDRKAIKACAHGDMEEILLLSYGQNEIVFDYCRAAVSGEIALMRDGLENHVSMLKRAHGIRINLEEASYYEVAFTVGYHGREYDGSMAVLVGSEAGENFVLEAELKELDTAFYEDNFPEGNYYYDLHGEE